MIWKGSHFLILILFAGKIACAQSSAPNEQRTSPETMAQLGSYVDLANSYYGSNLDSTIYFGERALTIAKSNQLDSLGADICGMLSGAYHFVGKNDMAIFYLGRAFELGAKTKNANAVMSGSMGYLEICKLLHDYQQGITFGDNLDKFYKQNCNPNFLSGFYSKMAELSALNRNYALTRAYIDSIQQMNNPRNEATVLHLRSLYYYHSGRLDSAYFYFQENESLSRDKVTRANAYASYYMSRCEQQMGMYHKALSRVTNSEEGIAACKDIDLQYEVFLLKSQLSLALGDTLNSFYSLREANALEENLRHEMVRRFRETLAQIDIQQISAKEQIVSEKVESVASSESDSKILFTIFLIFVVVIAVLSVYFGLLQRSGKRALLRKYKQTVADKAKLDASISYARIFQNNVLDSDTDVAHSSKFISVDNNTESGLQTGFVWTGEDQNHIVSIVVESQAGGVAASLQAYSAKLELDQNAHYLIGLAIGTSFAKLKQDEQFLEFHQESLNFTYIKYYKASKAVQVRTKGLKYTFNDGYLVDKKQGVQKVTVYNQNVYIETPSNANSILMADMERQIELHEPKAKTINDAIFLYKWDLASLNNQQNTNP